MFSVALCPSGLLTVTLTAPAACAGVFAVIVVLLVTLTLRADEPPKLTVAPETKLVPVRVTLVPPAVDPLVGVMLVTVGADGGGGGPPPVGGNIVVSLRKAPGALLRYVCADNTT